MTVVDTPYDATGRVHSVSNPYYSTSSTDGTTVFTYDALGRKTTQTQQDGNTQHWTPSGNMTTFKDEAGHPWQRTTDALGRLINVLEPTGSSTTYSYNLLNDLTLVTQTGVTTGETTRTRSFAYDSLSRLLIASNPETGTICYGQWTAGNCTNGYDANGNLSAKTDARGITVSYSYDTLNRLTKKQYSGEGGITPSSCFLYDTVSDLTISNSTGRLVQEWTQNGPCSSAAPASDKSTRRTILAYDPSGRILNEQRCILANCKTAAVPFSTTSTYDLAGKLRTYDNGLGTLTITNSYDAGGRLSQVESSVNDATHPSPLYSISDSRAFGAPHLSMLGGHISITQEYDSRLRSKSLSAVKQ